MFTARCCPTLEGGDDQIVCAAEIDRDGDAGTVARALSAPFYCRGDEGAWACECDGSSRWSYAAGCTGALLEACGKVAESLDSSSAKPPADCESTLPSRAGRCERGADGEYACTCEGASKRKLSHATTCEAALWASCAEDCSGADGRCEPATGALAGSYTCDCPQNRGTPRMASSRLCDDAVLFGCSVLGESLLGCNGYTGFCDRDGDDFDCTCLDGSEHHVAGTGFEQFSTPCQHALDSACGTEGAPANKVCTRNENSYEARCVQPFDDSAPFTCDCTFHGADADEVAGVEPSSSPRCEDNLLAACPQLEPIDAAARERACGYYDRCDTRPGFDYDACLASAPDGCVACTATDLDQLEAGKDGCPDGHPACLTQCREVVPRADAVAACRTALGDDATAEGKCLCDKCWPDFGECVTDTGCREMLDCIAKQGCKESACERDPVCGPIIMRYYSTHSLAILLNFGSCPARDSCAQP
jgi:hypothetical protein